MHLLLPINIFSIIFLQVINGGDIIPINIGTIRNISDSVPEMIFEETCPENMRPFSTNENGTDSVCDCDPSAFLYFPEKNSCHQAYEQGPCPPEHFLVFSEKGNSVKCEKNPCLQDGLVPFKGICATLYERGPPACTFSGVLRVNPDNFRLECYRSRNLHIIKAPEKKCPPGSRRNTLSVCKHIF